MKKLFFTIVVLFIFTDILFSVYGQTSKLEGKWVLNSVQVERYKPDGEIVKLQYDSTLAQDSILGVFQMMQFNGKQCLLSQYKKSATVGYVYENDILKLQINNLVYQYSVNDDYPNKLSLVRSFEEQSKDNPLVKTQYRVILLYNIQ